MQNSFFVSLCIFLHIQLAVAQKPIVKIGPDFSLPRGENFNNFIYSDTAGSYYMLFDAENKKEQDFKTGNTLIYYDLFLEKYDSNFNLVYSQQLEGEGDKVLSYGVKCFNGRLAWLYSTNNPKEDVINFTLNWIGLDGKKIEKIKLNDTRYKSKTHFPQTKWSISPDSTKMLIQAVSDFDNDEKKVEVAITVIGHTHEIVWTKKHILPYTEEQVDILGTTILNNGNVYMLAKVYEGEKAKESKKVNGESMPGYDLTLFGFDKEGVAVKQKNLNPGATFLKEAIVGSDNHNNVNCVYFYSKKEKGAYQGLGVAKFTSNGSVLLQKQNEFTAPDLEKFGEDNIEKNKGGDEGLANTFASKSLLISADGRLVFDSENIQTFASTSVRLNVTHYTSFCQDILLFFIDEKGLVTRISNIPKNQFSSTGTDSYLSHFALYRENEILIFYNDDKDKVKMPITEKRTHPMVGSMAPFANYITVMAKIDYNGNVISREQVLEVTDEAKYFFTPFNMAKISENKIFFVPLKYRISTTLTGSKFRFGTITFP